MANWIQDYWEQRNGFVFNRKIYNLAGWEEEYIPNQTAGNPRQQSNVRTESRNTALASVVSVPTLEPNYILDGSVYEIDCNSVNTPFVSGISSINYITQSSVPGCPVPVYDDTCRPYDTLPSLDSLPDEVASAISTQAECHHGKIDDDTSQSVSKPVAGITAQGHVTPSSNINDDNSAQVTQTYDVNDRGESRRGGRLRVQANSGGVDDHNPEFKDYVTAIIPVTITSRAGPPRAAPVSVTPVACPSLVSNPDDNSLFDSLIITWKYPAPFGNTPPKHQRPGGAVNGPKSYKPRPWYSPEMSLNPG